MFDYFYFTDNPTKNLNWALNMVLFIMLWC